MAITSTTICNSALTKIGAQRISDIAENTDRARLCNEQFNKLKEALLVSHPWKFALTRAELAEDATPPEYDWSSRFALPTDCLRVWGTDQGEDTWTTESRFLLANVSTIKIQYIQNISDFSKFTPSFAEALASVLAADICYALTKNAGLSEMLEKKARNAVASARNQNGQEGVGDRVYADLWLNSRN